METGRQDKKVVEIMARIGVVGDRPVIAIANGNCVTTVQRCERADGCAKVLIAVLCKENCVMQIYFEIKCLGNY